MKPVKASLCLCYPRLCLLAGIAFPHQLYRLALSKTGTNQSHNRINQWKTKFYLVKNFSVDDSSVDEIVKRSALQELDLNYRSFNQYSILFYKESAELDEHYLNNPNDMIDGMERI
jgi:hypothetical protein